MLPESPDDLRLRGDGPELLSQFQQGLGKQLIGNRLLIVKLPRQEDFVPPE
jgi:hypothetical protein